LPLKELESVIFLKTDLCSMVRELKAGMGIVSHSSGRPITFGETATGKYIAVVFDIVDEDPLSVYPVTAYETNP